MQTPTPRKEEQETDPPQQSIAQSNSLDEGNEIAFVPENEAKPTTRTPLDEYTPLSTPAPEPQPPAQVPSGSFPDTRPPIPSVASPQSVTSFAAAYQAPKDVVLYPQTIGKSMQQLPPQQQVQQQQQQLQQQQLQLQQPQQQQQQQQASFPPGWAAVPFSLQSQVNPQMFQMQLPENSLGGGGGSQDGQVILKPGQQLNASETNDTHETALSPYGNRYVDITEYLALPQSQAAQKLGIPCSTLSKRWKEAVRGRKWPFRTVARLDKQILTLLHNIPESSNAQLPPALEKTLAGLMQKRQAVLRPVVIRL